MVTKHITTFGFGFFILWYLSIFSVCRKKNKNVHVLVSHELSIILLISFWKMHSLKPLDSLHSCKSPKSLSLVTPKMLFGFDAQFAHPSCNVRDVRYTYHLHHAHHAVLLLQHFLHHVLPVHHDGLLHQLPPQLPQPGKSIVILC